MLKLNIMLFINRLFINIQLITRVFNGNIFYDYLVYPNDFYNSLLSQLYPAYNDGKKG